MVRQPYNDNPTLFLEGKIIFRTGVVITPTKAKKNLDNVKERY